MTSTLENDEKLNSISKWLGQHMPKAFYKEVSEEERELMAAQLLSFNWQEGFAICKSSTKAFGLCLNTQNADAKLLKYFSNQELRDYRTFVSTADIEILGHHERLRIIVVNFLEWQDSGKASLTNDEKEQIWTRLEAKASYSKEESFKLIDEISPFFLHLLDGEAIAITLDLLLKAKKDDYLEYVMRKEEEWESTLRPSLQVILALTHITQNRFLSQLTRLVKKHGLFLRRMNATYYKPYESESSLLVVFSLHGLEGQAAWEAASIDDFFQELAMIKMQPKLDDIEEIFSTRKDIKGTLTHFIRATCTYVHQMLVHDNPNLYTFENVEEAFCRHPELTAAICKTFESKLDPVVGSQEAFDLKYEETKNLIYKLDTGNFTLDDRRRVCLLVGLEFVRFTLKTNFFREDKLGLSFRIDPRILNNLPYDCSEKFPELPFAIFFIKSAYSFGFHIRFRDLARGGLRTVLPDREELYITERNQAFSEGYNLAYTQQKKNKDIPEGGSKAIILLRPIEASAEEVENQVKSLMLKGYSNQEIEDQRERIKIDHRTAYIQDAQKAFVDSLTVLVNCEPNGKIRSRFLLDYYEKPEYLYLGPDENMSNTMIQWIAEHSYKHNYLPGKAFISSKPNLGINHKEFGVTSYGVHIYAKKALEFLGIDPAKDAFTVKISGGPDGDVAGNAIRNLHRDFPNTAKITVITDVSGTIYDPEGLDLDELLSLFYQGQPIRFYPEEKIHDGGFLLDRWTQQEEDPYQQKTLLWKVEQGELKKTWISGHERSSLFRNNLFHAKTDLFIPAGGRPKTLNEENIESFLIDGIPTARAIVEGANLFFTPGARTVLEDLGVIIFKDSSANKGGVTCSSFEVLSGLILSEDEFREHKPVIVEEILAIIAQTAADEADLMLHAHSETHVPLTALSEKVSEKINLFTDQLQAYLARQELPKELDHPYNQVLLAYCPPFLSTHYKERIVNKLPDTHKKAMIACHIASRLVYSKGLNWWPELANILPLLLSDPSITSPRKKV